MQLDVKNVINLPKGVIKKNHSCGSLSIICFDLPLLSIPVCRNNHRVKGNAERPAYPTIKMAAILMADFLVF